MHNSKQRYKRQEWPKICIFCQEPGRTLTREDFWPVWMQEFLPLKSEVTTHHTRLVRDSGTLTPDLLEIGPGTLNRPGGPLSKRLKVVCRCCNNGWMSRLQKAAIPILKPLLNGEWSTLNESECLAISRWAVMFTMVYDTADTSTRSITQAERTFFMQSKTPPGNWLVLVGRLQDDRRHGTAWKRSFRTFSAGEEVEANFDAHSTTIGAGRFLLHVYGTSCSETSLQAESFSKLFPLGTAWPYVSPVEEPERAIDPINEFARLAQTANALAQGYSSVQSYYLPP